VADAEFEARVPAISVSQNLGKPFEGSDLAHNIEIACRQIDPRGTVPTNTGLTPQGSRICGVRPKCVRCPRSQLWIRQIAGVGDPSRT